MKKILLFLAAITLSHAQDIYTTGTPANGVNVTTADLIQFRDVSVTSGAGKVRPLAIGELVNVPGFFSSVPNGTFTLAKLAQSGATTGQVAKWNGSAWAPAADDGGANFADVAFYDDFSRYADGTVIGNMDTTPLVGATYRQHISSNQTPGNMYIEAGALRCPVGSNNYLGFHVPTPNGEFDMYFDIEVRRPAGSSEVLGGGAFTLSSKESQIVNNAGTEIAVSGAIHSNISLHEPLAISHFQQVTPVTKVSSNTNGFLTSAPSVGVRTLVRIFAKGDIYEVTAFGKTLRYQSTAFPGRIGNPTTFFYFQLNNTIFAGLPAPAVRCYTVLHRMWAGGNALKLGSTGEVASAFNGNVAARYPNKIDVQPATAFVGHDIGNRTSETLRVGGAVVSGNTFTGGGFYVEGQIRGTMMPGFNSGSPALELSQGASPFNSVKQSPANSVIGTAFHGLYMARPTNPPVGTRSDFHLAGTLGANGNTKRFQVREAGSVIFDSGDITQSGGVWEFKIIRHCLTGASELFVFDFWTQATGRLMTQVSLNRGATFTGFDLHVAGTALGDVTISTQRATWVPVVGP